MIIVFKSFSTGSFDYRSSKIFRFVYLILLLKYHLVIYLFPSQDLRCREEEVRRVRVQQKQIAEQLKKREEELHHRELDLLQREISIAIIQQQSAKPTPKKRKGKFKKKLLNRSHQISAPSGKV